MTEKTKKIMRLKLDPVMQGLLERRAAISGRSVEQELQDVIDKALSEIATSAIANNDRTH